MTMQLKGGRTTPRKDFNEVFDTFTEGVVSAVLESRLSKKAAKQASSLMQTDDGLWSTAWGSAYYGQALPNAANIDGAAEYVKSDGTTETIAIGNIAYKSTDGGTWTQITGATFTAGHTLYFLQIKNWLYITNGVDSLSYYDGTNLHTYTDISAPTVSTITVGASLTATPTNYPYFYTVTALNDVGETVGSTEVTASVNKLKDNWSLDTDSITLGWGAVAGARSYSVYSSSESGYETYLASVEVTGYVDKNQDTLNPYVEVPDDNTTGAPKFKQMELSGNRLWATDDPDNKYRVYFSGTGQYMGYFSGFYGGGYTDLEKGGRDMPKSVCHYRTGKGDPVVTVLTSSPEGKGSTWQIDLSSITVGDVTFTVPASTKVVGAIGTSAPLSVTKIGNSVLFFNKKGFSILGSKVNLLNILSVDEISFNIRPDVNNLYGSLVDKVAGYFYSGKAFFAVPTSNAGNDKVMVYDVERKNWNPNVMPIAIRHFFEYTDSSGVTKFLAVPYAGTRLIQISDTITGNLGEAMPTQYLSGLYPISTDRTVWAKVKYAYIELGNPKGTINFSLLGTEKKKGFSTLGSVTITDLVSSTGWSYEKYSTSKYSTSTGSPSTFSSSSRIKRIRINKLLNNYQFKVSSSDVDTKYTLMRLQVKGKILPTQDPASWK